MSRLPIGEVVCGDALAVMASLPDGCCTRDRVTW